MSAAAAIANSSDAAETPQPASAVQNDQATNTSDTQNADPATAPPKKNADKPDGDQPDAAVAGDTAASPSQVTAMQPIAAVFVVNNAPAPAAASGPASDLMIGDKPAPRGRMTLSPDNAPGGLPVQLTSDGAATQSVPAGGNSSTVQTSQAAASDSQPAGAGNDQATGDTAPQPAQRPDLFAAPPAAPDSSAQPASDPAMLRAAGLIANAATDPPAPNAPTTNASKAASGTVADVGLSPAAALQTQTLVATPGAPPATAVPVAGLPVAIFARAQAGSNQFEIRLDPPELGRIDVRLDIDGNGQVTSHVTVDRPETLNLLQSQQPQLERALEQAGLRTADNGLQFTLRDQSFGGQNPGGGAPQQMPAPLVVPAADLPAVETTQIYSRISLGSGVDIRV